MAARHRLGGQAYTCENRKFHTDTNAGHPHGPNQAKGSVFTTPLYQAPTHSLWLEYLVDKDAGNWEPMWFMWYDGNGDPTIPASGAFDKSSLNDIVARLSAFIEIK